MPRTYVDNAYNRSAGRVGMAHGTAVISSSGRGSSSYGGAGGGGRSYVDNSSNRALGRVGLPVGSAALGSNNSHSTGNVSRAYVDNAQNRSLGRVGLPVGSAVHSTRNSNSGSSAHGSTKTTYVDNEMNRSLGRVGLLLGSAVHSKSEGKTHSPLSSSAATRSMGATCYVDNAYNRRLGRVGLAYGTAVMSTKTPNSANLNGNKKFYVDNPINRKLGRVGKPLGTAPVQNSKSIRCHSPLDDVFKPLIRIDPEDTDLGEILRQIRRLRDDRRNNEEADSFREHNYDAAEGIVYRHEAALTKHRAGLQTPEWVRGGEVIDFKDIELGEKLGSGGFGDVHVGIWKNNFQVAIKKLRVQRVSQQRKEQFQAEVKVFSSLSHPCIVKFFGVCVTPPNLAIVMEFMAGGSLHEVLHVEMRDLSSNQKYQMVTDSLSALKYMHGKHIAHRDIKSMNILVCDDYTHCKLGDFGLALKEESRSSASVADHGVVGTLSYSPPEVIRGERLNIEGLKSADIYSMTIVIIELLTGQRPYDGMNQHQIRAAIMNKERPSIASLTDMNEEAKELLRRGMSSTRPSASTMYSSWNLLALGNQLGRLTLAGSSHSVTRTDPNMMSSLSPLSRGLSYSSQLQSLDRSSRSGVVDDHDRSTASLSSTSSSGRRSCPVCTSNGVEYVFQCGHATCKTCFLALQTNNSTCPKCRGSIAPAIKLFL